ncbi:MAG: hypothetical protein GF341_10940, partial [candidate division Zixibacteria bacterium]|nr:hypothetical protein [candidate division Zixibacteria bacterium]
MRYCRFFLVAGVIIVSVLGAADRAVGTSFPADVQELKYELICDELVFPDDGSIPIPPGTERGIRALTCYDGRLHIGRGTCNCEDCTTDLISLRLSDHQFIDEQYTINELCVAKYSLLDGTLAIAGVEATDFTPGRPYDEFCSIYLRDDTGWAKCGPIRGVLHIMDVRDYSGAWYAGVNNTDDGGRGVVYWSFDQGDSWSTAFEEPVTVDGSLDILRPSNFAIHD